MKKELLIKRIVKELFCSSDGIEAAYLLSTTMFVFVFVMLGIRIAEVFFAVKGSSLSDTLILGMTTAVLGLLSIYNFGKRRKGN